MGLSVLYVPASESAKAELWEKIRAWQKVSGLSWEKIRVTPDFYTPTGAQRDEMQGMLDMVRNGSIDRVLYSDLTESQTRDLDWLAFAFSLQRYRVSVEVIGNGSLDLAKKMQDLTAGIQAMQTPSSI